jgi:hypothetical protein
MQLGNIKKFAVLYMVLWAMWSMTAMKQQKRTLSFEVSSPWSLVILCGQSVSTNHGLYIQVQILQCCRILVSCLGQVWGSKYLF